MINWLTNKITQNLQGELKRNIAHFNKQKLELEQERLEFEKKRSKNIAEIEKLSEDLNKNIKLVKTLDYNNDEALIKHFMNLIRRAYHDPDQFEVDMDRRYRDAGLDRESKVDPLAGKVRSLFKGIVRDSSKEIQSGAIEEFKKELATEKVVADIVSRINSLRVKND